MSEYDYYSDAGELVRVKKGEHYSYNATMVNPEDPMIKKAIKNKEFRTFDSSQGLYCQIIDGIKKCFSKPAKMGGRRTRRKNNRKKRKTRARRKVRKSHKKRGKGRKRRRTHKKK